MRKERARLYMTS